MNRPTNSRAQPRCCFQIVPALCGSLLAFLSLAFQIKAADPDLLARSLTWAGTPTAGQNLTMTWQITNAGPGSAAGFWHDRLTLSTNSTTNGAVIRWNIDPYPNTHHNLQPGGTYVMSTTQTLPAVADGPYYLIIETDTASNPRVAESNETNNMLVVAMSIGIGELVPTALRTNNVAIAGRLLSVSWTVSNPSTNLLIGNWNDQLFLSTNSTTNGAIAVWSYNDYFTAPGGGVYSRARNISLPPIPGGNYWLILYVDAGKVVPETNELNNTRIFPLWVTNIPPAVTLLTPTNVQRKICVPATFKLSAQVDVGSYAVSRVDYYNNGMPIGQSTNGPLYRMDSTALTQGIHQITVQAVDVMGLRATSQVAQVTLTWPLLHELLAELNTNGEVVCCMGALLNSNYVMETAATLQNSNTAWQPYFTNQVTWTNLVFTTHPILPQRYFRARFWP
jgi:hypothetical protein